MLVEGEGAPQNDFDSYRGHLLVGSAIMISILVGEGHLLIRANFFSLVKLFDLRYPYFGRRLLL